MRPPLSWRWGQTIAALRKTTPLEAVRIASFNDDYERYLRSFDDSDEFVFNAVNGAVPIRTGRAIMTSVFDHLVACNVPVDPPSKTTRSVNFLNSSRNVPTYYSQRDKLAEMETEPHQVEATPGFIGVMWSYAKRWLPRSLQVDTGSDATLVHTDLDPVLRDAKRSRVQLHMVDKNNSMGTSQEGTLEAMVLNTAGHRGIRSEQPLNLSVISVPNLNRELFSFET